MPSKTRSNYPSPRSIGSGKERRCRVRARTFRRLEERPRTHPWALPSALAFIHSVAPGSLPHIGQIRTGPQGPAASFWA